MSDFAEAIEYVLKREGGFSGSSKHDVGGATNYGISLRFLRELPIETLRKYAIYDAEIDEQTIRDLTQDQAKNIYLSEFWNHARFKDIASQFVCNYIFDMAVNFGIGQAIKIVQRSLWAVFYSRKFIVDDGILGDLTLDRLNIIEPDMLMPVLVASRAAFYRLLAEKRPKDKENLNGWLNRCYQVD